MGASSFFMEKGGENMSLLVGIVIGYLLYWKWHREEKDT